MDKPPSINRPLGLDLSATYRRTKIVCTLGPATNSPEIIEGLIEAGMNVARLNFSHGTHEDHKVFIDLVRNAAAKLGRSVAILQDLTGPKMRIGKFDQEIMLIEGEEFTLTTREVPGTQHEVWMNYPDLPNELEEGDTVLLADSNLHLKVIETNETDVRCKIIIGGPLSSNKGINLPYRTINIPSITEKDRSDLEFGVKHGVDFVALSFVRTAEDVRGAKRLISDLGSDAPLIAKIEKHEAIDNIDAIINAADGIMVARGDLGIETHLERVPIFQKRIIEKANFAGKPVITATQMLASMVDHMRPSRAEAGDVANAILDGTDAVMLSEETSVGKYPVQTVLTMSRIAQVTEQSFPYSSWTHRFDLDPDVETPLQEAISHAACELAESIHADAILTFTQLGFTAASVSRHRPQPVILAATPLEKVYQRLALYWGVQPFRIEPMATTAVMVDKAREIAQASALLEKGQKIVITSGVPVGVPNTTNSITTIYLD